MAIPGSHSGQPRLGLVAFSSLREHTAGELPAIPRRFPSLAEASGGQLLVVFGRTSSQPRVAMPGRFRLDDRVTCVRNNNAMGKRHAGTISKVRRTVRIIVMATHSSISRAGHRGRARPRLEPPRRLRRLPLLLGRHGDGRRVQARRHVVLLYSV